MSSEINWLDFFEDQERRHADFYLDFAQQHARRDAEAYDQLEVESGNLLKIASWLGEHDDDENILKLTNILWLDSDFLHTRGYLQRGLPLLEQACQAACRTEDPRVEFTWLEAFAYAHGSIGNLALAHSTLEQVLSLAQEINESKFKAKAQLEMGRLQIEMGHLDHATIWLEQALQEYRQGQDYEGEITTLTVLGNLLSLQGDSDGAVEYLEQGLFLAQARQDRHGEVDLRFALGYVGTATQNWPMAIEHFEPVLEMAQAIGNRFLEVRTLINLGEAWLELGDVQKAVILLEEALARQETSDDIISKAFAHFYLGKACYILNNLEQALAHMSQVTIFRQIPNVIDIAAEATWIEANCYLKQNNNYSAQAALHDVLNLAPDHMVDIRRSATSLLKLINLEVEGR